MYMKEKKNFLFDFDEEDKRLIKKKKLYLFSIFLRWERDKKKD